MGMDIKGITQDEFEEKLCGILKEKHNRENFKRKVWKNYPHSVFYYFENDEKMQNEIAIFTNGISRFEIYI